MNLLKDTDAVKFEEVNKVKLYIIQIIFQRNAACYVYQKNYCSALFLFLFVCFFFLLCFCEKVLGNFGRFTCITLVIGFFYPLDCNLDLVKRKGAELTSKYFKMSNLNFCNN